jgi:hexosaminidase
VTHGRTICSLAPATKDADHPGMRNIIVFLLAALVASSAKGVAAMSEAAPLPLIPAPRTWAPAGGRLDAASVQRIVVVGGGEAALRQARLLAAWWREAGGAELPVQQAGPGDVPAGAITLETGPGPDTAPNAPGAVDERCTLVVTPGGMAVTAPAPAGLFRGVEAVRQLGLAAFTAGGGIAAGRAELAPRFRWRGMLLDSGRHMQDVDFILDLVDELALYGFNVLHWHLTEDQGWRLEIPGHPALTEVGAWRTQPDGTRYGGFYSTDDVRRVVAHAASRFITVVPEIELPGHAKAALAAYPELSCTGGPFAVETQWGIHEDVYCAGNDAVFALHEDIFDHVTAVFPSQYVHVGGDEVPKDRWLVCPRCRARMQQEGLPDVHALQSWFVRRAERMLSDRGRRLVGWDEILEGGLSPTATVQSWRGIAGAVAAVTAGNDAVVSPTSHAYFDYDPGQLPLEQVLTFDPVPADLPPGAEARILGGAMNLWTEYAPQPLVHRQVYPRITAMAEALGAPAGEKDLGPFLERMAAHAAFWPRLGVTAGAASRPVVLDIEVNEDGSHTIAASKSEAAERLLGGLDTRFMVGSLPLPEGWRPDALPEEQLDLPLDGLEVGAGWTGRPADARLLAARLEIRREGGDWAPYGAPAAVELHPSLARGRDVAFVQPPSLRYPGRGRMPMTDGARGGRDFRDGRWMGFETHDLDAVIDLGAPTPVSELSIRCIQDANAWVFLPREVVFLVSDDGTAWREAGRAGHGLSDKEQRKTIVEFAATVDATVRFVRVVAANLRTCPAWHPGAGQPCWLFVDEFSVR